MYCKDRIEFLKFQLSNLISNIKLCIEQNKNKRREGIISIITSVLQKGAGIAGACFADGIGKKIYYGGVALLNIGNIVLDGINIDLLQKNIKSLDELLKDANKLDKEMEDKIKEKKKN